MSHPDWSANVYKDYAMCHILFGQF